MSTLQPPSEDDFVRITLRIPSKLHAQLTEAAAKKRSMNAEIISRLEATFDSNVEAVALELAAEGTVSDIVERIVEGIQNKYKESVQQLDVRAEKLAKDNDRLAAELDEIRNEIRRQKMVRDNKS